MLNILFKCRSCGKQLIREDSCAGTQVNCRNCGASLTVPKTVIVYTCPHSDCSRPIKIDIALRGDGLDCPSCNKSIMLPIQRSDVIVFLCKRCEKIIEIPIAEAGKLLPCPKCDEWIRGPELKEIAGASANVTEGLAYPSGTGPESLTGDDQNLSVLIIDDNKMDQQLVANHLAEIRSWKDRPDLEFATDGEEALAKLRKKNFALIILDWNLPALGQGEVLRSLRQNGSRIPAVVISGVGSHHLVNELAANQGTFLSKDTMSPATFHVAICLALALVDINVSHFFEMRPGKSA